MSSHNHVRYFPFSPGIPWKIKRGKYIVPELNSDSWRKAIQDREVVVVAHGGLIESFVSLNYFEIVNYISPNTKLLWHGNTKFNRLIEINGLSNICESDVTADVFAGYPVPLFLDQQQNTYFNCLNNYLRVRTWFGVSGYKDRRPVFRQLLRNALVPWTSQYIPKIRSAQWYEEEIVRWSQVKRFDFQRPYICIFPDKGWSQHKASALGWNDAQVRAFSAMLKQAGIPAIVVTNHAQKYYGSDCLPMKVDNAWYVLQNSFAVLSEEADPLLMALMISDSRIISKPLRNELSLSKNRDFIARQNDIYTIKKLQPLDAFNIVRGDL